MKSLLKKLDDASTLRMEKRSRVRSGFIGIVGITLLLSIGGLFGLASASDHADPAKSVLAASAGLPMLGLLTPATGSPDGGGGSVKEPKPKSGVLALAKSFLTGNRAEGGGDDPAPGGDGDEDDPAPGGDGEGDEGGGDPKVSADTLAKATAALEAATARCNEATGKLKEATEENSKLKAENSKLKEDGTKLAEEVVRLNGAAASASKRAATIAKSLNVPQGDLPEAEAGGGDSPLMSGDYEADTANLSGAALTAYFRANKDALSKAARIERLESNPTDRSSWAGSSSGNN